MRQLIFLPILWCSLLCLNGCAFLSKIKPDRLAIHSGYSWSPIKGADVQAIPKAIRLELGLNDALTLNPKYGRLDLGFEAFSITTIEPEFGTLAGITPMLRYSYPLHESLRPYLEVGAGPIYLSFDTFEQEEKGFSFYDQVGAGVEIVSFDGVTFLLGYRFSHVSHGRVLRTRNRGIEGSTVIFGVTFALP